MYKHILVAIDGSETGHSALSEAMALAHRLGSTLRILHVVDRGAVSWGLEFVDPTEIWQAMTDRGRRLLDGAAAAAAKAGVKAEVRLVETDMPGRRIAETVVDEARAWPADLVVVGTHGRHGVSRALLGSVAEGVVRSTQHPVLLVHHAGDAPAN